MGIELELFDWEEWDGEAECMTFYNPVLKVAIGKFPAGSKFDSATIVSDSKDGVGGYLQLTNYNCPTITNGCEHRQALIMGEFKLHYRVGDEL